MRISDWSSDVCSSDLLEFGQPGQLGFPCRAEHRAIRRLPMTCLQRFGRGNGIAERPDQAHADMDSAVVVGETARPALDGGAARRTIDQNLRAARADLRDRQSAW